MGDNRDRLEAELTEVFTSQRSALCQWVQCAFPRLAAQAEDIVQQSYLETLQRVRDEEFFPKTGWIKWLRIVIRSRAVDRLRSWERKVFQRLALNSNRGESHESSEDVSPQPMAVAREPDPSRQLADQERRSRQGLLLSEVLQEFSRWCEARPERAGIKEAYERSLRGQEPAQIAAAMGLSGARVYEYLNRARSWVFQRIRQADVDRSIFLTLHRRKPE